MNITSAHFYSFFTCISTSNNSHPKVKFDDSILYEGSAAFCWFALRWLKDKS